MKTKRDTLRDLVNPHARYWSCYNDEPLEYNHTGKLVKICSEFSIAFSVFCAENYDLKLYGEVGKWFCRKSGKERTTEQLMTIYLKQKSE